MEEPPSARRFSLPFLLAGGGILLVAILAYALTRPPRLVWGSWFLSPTLPLNHRGYQTYGASDFEELRLRLSGNHTVFLFVPPDGSSSTRWPRLTGRRRPIVADQSGDQEIELVPP